MSRYVQIAQVRFGVPTRVHGRPLGAVTDETGTVCVLLETGDAVLREELFEVWAVTPHHPVPEGGEFVAAARDGLGQLLAVYTAPAR